MHFSFKTVIKLLQHGLPASLSVFDFIQAGFHMVGKLQVNNIAEVILHEACDHFAQRRRLQIFALFDHIIMGCNG